MNLEHVANALNEQNKIASEMLEIMKGQEERNARGEARSIEIHALACEVSTLAIEREKRMAIIDAETAERMARFKDQIQIEFPAVPGKQAD